MAIKILGGINMSKSFKVVNGQARGILQRMSEGLKEVSFVPKGVTSAADIMNQIQENQGVFGTRTAGQGFNGRRTVESAQNESKVDFDVIGGKAFYTGDVKELNSLLNGASDIETLNVRMGMVVNVGNKEVVNAQADRLSIGDKDTYNKMTLSGTERAEYEGFKIVNRSQKSWEQMVSIPLGSVDPEEIESTLNEVYMVVQSLRDSVMTDVEESDIGSDPIFREMAKYLHTKDVAKTMMGKIDPNLSSDDLNQVMEALFNLNNLGPMSTMTLSLTFTVTKVVRTNDPDRYYDYDQHDPSANALRSFINRYDVRLPINPMILVKNSQLLEDVKAYSLGRILQLFNKATDPEAQVDVPTKPIINLKPHNIAGITKEEFSEFQTNILPGKVKEAIQSYHEAMKVAAVRKVTSSQEFQ